jgi:hypothetical protein
VAVAVFALATPAALANGATTYKIFSDYTKDGQIDPCKYSTADLQAALAAVTPDVKQYASDYPGAIKAAIAARASGACDKKSSAAPPAAVATPTAAPSVEPVTPGATKQTVIAAPPGPAGVVPDGEAPEGTGDLALDQAAHRTPSNDAPAPLIGLGILAILLALTAALLVALRRLGFGEGRLAPAYHSWREARWRAGGVWDDFLDWLRVGR